ncbi:MAG: CerR family C-terminal domain-containing protein [Pirellulaceae bacterium]|nr:CerR family C-terminal domain-containing protein [Pirellulaceae bacterium]
MATDDTRQRILNAAGEVFADKGFQMATIREICGHAGANLAAVNYYFGDKEKLYVEVLKAAHPGIPEPGASEMWPEDAPPAERLKVFIRQLLARLFRTDAPAWRMRLFQREVLDPTPFCTEIVQTYFREKFFQLMNVLDEMLPPDMPLQRRHQVAFSIIGQCVYFRAAGHVIGMVIGEEERSKYHTVDLLAEHVAGLVLAALGLATPLGRTTGTDGDNPATTITNNRPPLAAPHRGRETGVDQFGTG